MDRNCDYAVVRLLDGAYRLDRTTDPYPGPVAHIKPIEDRKGTPTGWRLRPIVVMQGSPSKVWGTAAEVIASTKLMTPGQARSAVAAADAAGAP